MYIHYFHAPSIRVFISYLFRIKTLVFIIGLYTYPGRCQQSNGAVYLHLADSFKQVKEYAKGMQYADSAYLFFEEEICSDGYYKAIDFKTYFLSPLGKHELANKQIKRYIQAIEEHCKDNNRLIAALYTRLAASYEKMPAELYRQALENYEKAIQIFRKHNMFDVSFVYALINAANTSIRLLDYDKAEAYLKEAVKADVHNRYKYRITYSTARNYYHAKKYQEALNVIQSYLNNSISSRQKVGLGMLLGSIYLELDKINLAKQHIVEVLTIKTAKAPRGIPLCEIQKTLADIHHTENNLPLAKQYYAKSIASAKEIYTHKNREFAKLYAHVGDFYYAINQLDTALYYYQQAIIQAYPNFNSENIADNPSLDEVYVESWAMTAPAKKAAVLKELYDKNKDITLLANAAHCYDLSFAVVNLIRHSYGSEEAKYYLADYNSSAVEEAIAVNYLLYEDGKSDHYLEKVFRLMEWSKATVLVEAINRNKSTALSEIPDSLLEQEQILRAEIAAAHISLQKAQAAKTHDTIVEQHRFEWEKRKQEHHFLVNSLKEAYPRYAQLLTGFDIPSLTEVHAYAIEKNTVVVEYFLGKNHIYVLSITPGDIQLHRHAIDSTFQHNLQHFLRYFRNKDRIANDPQGYTQSAHELYNVLFQNIINNKKLSLRNLLVIPDKNLHFIPFDALLTDEVATGTEMHAWPYLARDYAIRVGYSTTVLFNQQSEHKKKLQKYWGLAPTFLNNRLPELLWSQQEVEALRQLGKGDIQVGKDATLQRFMTEAGQYHLLHLSTHALSESGDIAPHIEFSDSTLYLPTLYGMHLYADLAILSACQSGLGEVKAGEGVLSLARGFQYAGVRNLIVSLWNVNDKTSTDIFSAFYTSLRKKNIPAALQKAKLSYLQNTAIKDLHKSPYYWAGLVYYGEDEGFGNNGVGIPLWTWIAGSVLIAFLLGIKVLKHK